MDSFGRLRASGLTRSQIDRLLDSGSLERIRRGVYGREGVCSDVRAAAAHGGALACVSAARHLGLWVLEGPEVVHVGLGAHGRTYAHDGCRCLAHWEDNTATTAFGLPSVARVLRQILRCRGVEQFFVALESARRQGRLSRRQIDWLRRHINDAGREAIDCSRTDADSGLESLVRWRLRHHGLQIRTQVGIVSVGHVDLVIGERLIVEVDGIDNHDAPSHRHKDLVRDANAAAWGYVTLRFDYAMVVHDWETVEAAILAHVGRGLHLA